MIAGRMGPSTVTAMPVTAKPRQSSHPEGYLFDEDCAVVLRSFIWASARVFDDLPTPNVPEVRADRPQLGYTALARVTAPSDHGTPLTERAGKKLSLMRHATMWVDA